MENGVEDARVEPWVRLYVERGAPLPRVVPAPVARKWFGPEMYRCLPLTIANQMGWTVPNPAAFSATWDGGDSPDAVTGATNGSHVMSRFGHGLISIHPGFYVRTSPDVDLFVKGVPNRPKDGVACLEALIETDWFDGSFLVSLRLTRPGLTVVWERDEPLFQLVPYPRGWLRRFRTETITDGAVHAEFFAALERWHRDREARLEPLLRNQLPPNPFDGRYRRGLRGNDDRGPEGHQTSLDLPLFTALDPGPVEY
jgi:Family of unknown function (DUF6065)